MRFAQVTLWMKYRASVPDATPLGPISFEGFDNIKNVVIWQMTESMTESGVSVEDITLQSAEVFEEVNGSGEDQ